MKPLYKHDCEDCTYLFTEGDLDIYKQCGKDNGYTFRKSSESSDYGTVPLPEHIAGHPMNNRQRLIELYPWFERAEAAANLSNV
jgi:hypothetical protein